MTRLHAMLIAALAVALLAGLIAWGVFLWRAPWYFRGLHSRVSDLESRLGTIEANQMRVELVGGRVKVIPIVKEGK